MPKFITDINNAMLITHGGNFHADDVLATCILRHVFPDAKVARVFEIQKSACKGKIVYDIGGGALDHHQAGGNGWHQNGIPYASAGLVWKKFGRRAITGANASEKDYIFNTVDRRLIQPIDAYDNGVMPKVKYATQPLSAAEIIEAFNPSWDSEESTDDAFERAVQFMDQIYRNEVERAAAIARGKSIAMAAIDNAKGHIMILDTYVPYEVAAVKANKKRDCNDAIWYCVFPSNRGGWNCYCIPMHGDHFKRIKLFPRSWRGKPPEKLQELTGIMTIKFCHRDGFVVATDTKADAITAAKLAVKA